MEPEQPDALALGHRGDDQAAAVLFQSMCKLMATFVFLSFAALTREYCNAELRKQLHGSC